jgi:hypothetical protein
MIGYHTHDEFPPTQTLVVYPGVLLFSGPGFLDEVCSGSLQVMADMKAVLN